MRIDSIFTLSCPDKTLLPTEDDQTGGRSDNCACAKRGGEAKGGGLDPMALSASPLLPPACHRHQMTRGEWQLHANSGAGEPDRGEQLLQR